MTDAPPWLGELLNSVRDMRGLLSKQIVTRDQFERYHAEYSNLVVSTVEDAVLPIRHDLSSLTTRVEVLENSKDFLRDPNDPALRRIVVLGIESNDAKARIAAIGDWLRANIPEVRIGHVENFYRRDQTDRKKWEISNAAYIKFSDCALREIDLERFMGKPPFNISGNKVDFKRALSKEAGARHNVLKDL